MFTKERKVLKDYEETIDLGRKIYRENKLAKQILSLRIRPKISPLWPRRIGLDRQDLGKETYRERELGEIQGRIKSQFRLLVETSLYLNLRSYTSSPTKWDSLSSTAKEEVS